MDPHDLTSRPVDDAPENAADPRLHGAPGARTYEGRLLAHQDEPLADQGLGFDLATLAGRRRTRRSALAGLGIGTAVIGLAACGTSSSTSATSTSASDSGGSDATSSDGEIPEETNGPYPADGTNGVTVLTESGIVRSDIRSSFGTSSTTAEGVPMTLTLTLTNLAESNAAYEGVAVYVWHCNAAGEYSLYSEGLEEENYLRGVQVADADGKVTFTSIFPACYSGRWPHIHFEVYPDADSITSTDNLLATSQVALPQAVCETVYALDAYSGSSENLSQVTLDSDNVFGDDGGELQLAEVEGDATSGFTVTLPVAIDPDTEPGVTDSAPAVGGGPSDAGGGPGGTPPSGAPLQGGTPPGGASDSGGSMVGNQLVGSR
ncbi:dioxygenase family protein [Brachybacterium huguangmaarense]